MSKFFVISSAMAAVLASSGVAIAAPVPRDEPAPKSIQVTSSVETIAYTRRKTPTPGAGYLGSASYSGAGLAGVLISVATAAAMDHVSGSRTLAAHHLRDPSPDISRALAETLAQHRGAIAANEAVFIKSAKPAAIAKAAPSARYVVDVQTLDWQVAGMSTKKSQYPSSYSAILRVVDGVSGKVAVSANCYWASPQIKVSPEGLSGDKTDILKNHFEAATEACFEQFKIPVRSLHLPGIEPQPPTYSPSRQVAVTMPVPPNPPEPSRIEQRVAPPQAVTVVALSPAPPVSVQARSAPPPPTVRTQQPLPPSSQPTRTQAPAASTVNAQLPAREPRSSATPPYAEYPYARPYEAPPSRTLPPPEVRYAGRDANGYLTWPGKRP